MSRTYKDTPWKLRYPEQQWDYKYERIEGYRWWFRYLERPGVLTKKKRSYQEYHGMPTPMWWVREFMNQPQRTRGKEWEKKVINTPVDELVDLDLPSVGRKPHLYYW